MQGTLSSAPIVSPETVEERVRSLASLRSSTDHWIASHWAAWPVASWFLWVAYGIELYTLRGIPRDSPLIQTAMFTITAGGALGALAVVAFLTTLPLGYLVYLLVNRRNKHFARSENLLRAVANRLSSRESVSSTASASVMLPLGSAERTLSMLGFLEKERSAYLWSLLSLIPFLGIVFVVAYTLKFLGDDYREHEKRELGVIEDIQRSLGSHEPSSWSVHQPRYVAHRNTTAYLAGAILTGGLLNLLWLHISITDPDSHFRVHSELENLLLSRVSSTLTSPNLRSS